MTLEFWCWNLKQNFPALMISLSDFQDNIVTERIWIHQNNFWVFQLTWLGRNHKFWEHSLSLPKDCQVWCPDGWFGNCEGTWHPWGSGRGTPWCGPRTGAGGTRWSCGGHSASARLWGRFLEKSQCGGAENNRKIISQRDNCNKQSQISFGIQNKVQFLKQTRRGKD